MDNIGEVITFLIFAIIYFFVSVIGKKGEDEPRRTRRSREADSLETDEGEPTGPDPAAEFRRIQEEIRRRIRERTHPGESPAEDSPAEVQPEPTRETTPIPTPVVLRREREFEAPATQTDPLAELQAMQDRAEQSRLDLESKRTAYTRPSEKPRRRYHTTVNYASLREKTIANLKQPQSARAAFIYQEIFGTPVGMRDSKGTTRPSWQQ